MSCREDKARYLMTQSLLAAWQYNLSGGSQEEFLSVLRREKTEQTQAMKDGMEFERLVWECACGKEPEEKHKWAKGIREIAEIIRGGAYQVALSDEAEIEGEEYLLYGIADFVKKGVIFDVKFSKRYENRGNVNYYLTSPQAPMYLRLLPSAKQFVFLISDGVQVFREAYTQEEITPIEKTAAAFTKNLKQRGLWDIYTAFWRSDKERR